MNFQFKPELFAQIPLLLSGMIIGFHQCISLDKLRFVPHGGNIKFGMMRGHFGFGILFELHKAWTYADTIICG